MTFPSYYQDVGISIVPDVKIVPGGSRERRELQVACDFCYILQISRIVVREGVSRGEFSICTDHATGILALPEGMSLRKVDTFVCRSLKTAKEMMLDFEWLRTDWVRRHDESDEEGKILQIFLSTDGYYMARISRAELF